MTSDMSKEQNSNVLSDQIWQAIVKNDASFDGKFFYAVKTTGIFCRPSCKSRPPSKQHVRIFHNVQQALEEGFRSCKRCKPDWRLLPDEQWVAQIAKWIEVNFAEAITLDRLASEFHGSSYHLQRTFKRIKGMTPAEYIQQIRISKSIQYLSDTDMTVMEIALAVGISNAAYFATLFQRVAGLTPTDFRRSAAMMNSHDEEVKRMNQ